MALKIINLDTPSLGDRSYIAHDGKMAVVIDPQRDIDRITAILAAEGVELGAVVETHMHNDYVSGGLVLAREFGARYITSKEDPVKFERTPASDLEEFLIGDFALKALATPGHTFTHLSYILLNKAGLAEAIFTGGSLLHGSTGRPDLLGPDHAKALATHQHSSAHRIVKMLEDTISIYPTHGFGSFCAATSTSGDSSTIADERVGNPALLLSPEEFVQQTLAGLDAFPAYYKHMGPANHAGAAPIDLTALKEMSSDEILKGMKAGAWVVDLRHRDLWSEGHLKGSINFGVEGSFATYFGWIFPFEKEVILISDQKEDISKAQRELVRIGIDRPKASFVGEISSISEKTSVKKVTFEDLPQALKDEDKLVLDVRRNGERKSSHIVGSIHIPLHQLEEKVNSLPKDKEIWVHCAGAYRASAAVGLLEQANLHPVLINEPYEKALTVSALNIASEGLDLTPNAPSVRKNQNPKLPA